MSKPLASARKRMGVENAGEVSALDLNESSGGSLQNSILLAWRINPKETDK